MSILLDHCVPRKCLHLLTSWGYDAHVMTEYIAADSGDADVLRLAQKLDAVLLTVDLDFSSILNYPPEDYPGLIVMRYEARDENALTATLQQALSDLYRDDLRSALVIITPKRYRIRQS